MRALFIMHHLEMGIRVYKAHIVNKGRHWNSGTPNTRAERQFNCWLSVLIFLFTLPRCQVIFQWKQTKGKLGNALIAWRNFCVNLTWRMGNICQFYWVFFQELPRLHILFHIYKRSTEQRRRGRAPWGKTRSRKNEKRQRNNNSKQTRNNKSKQISRNNKSKQISFEITCAWDCFTTWKITCMMYLYWNLFQ